MIFLMILMTLSNLALIIALVFIDEIRIYVRYKQKVSMALDSFVNEVKGNKDEK